MKLHALFLGSILWLFPLIGSAAVPVVQSVGAASVVLGEGLVIKVRVTDSDGGLDYVRLSVSGPGIAGNQVIADGLLVSGSDASAEFPWVAPQPGVYTVQATVHALGGSHSRQTTVEVLSGRRLIQNLTITSGVSRMFTESGEILTKETSPAANVRAQSGGTLIFWSGGRVTLKSGFHAQAGSFFWGTVDHDNDGYSDVEETIDTDLDGIFDAWEVDHGLNPVAVDAHLDTDGDGMTNLQEFQQGRDPSRKDNPAIALSIFTPAL